MIYKKKKDKVSMILGIIGTAFSVIVPIVTYACSIPGLIIGIKKKKLNYNANAGIALNIVAISIAFVNSLFAAIVSIKMTFGKNKKLEEK